MNKTRHGRWGRFKTNDQGEKMKLCNGALHPPEGAWLHLRSFWIMKSGPRKGKPMTQCIECLKTEKGRNPRTSGLIPVSRIWWVFLEIQRRVGKAEACRRIGVSQNMWYRVERGIYFNMRRATARKAISALVELRKDNVVRHRTSIRRGSAMRGEPERIPTRRRDFYTVDGDADNERRGNYRKEHLEHERELDRARKRRKREASG